MELQGHLLSGDNDSLQPIGSLRSLLSPLIDTTPEGTRHLELFPIALVWSHQLFENGHPP